MKRPHTKFHVHTMRESQVIRSNKIQNLSLGQTCSIVFLFIDILFKTTDIYMLLQVLLQFCDYNGLATTSVFIMGLLQFCNYNGLRLIMLFFSLLDD